MDNSRKGSIGKDIATWLCIVIGLAVVIVAWSQYSHDRAIIKPEFIRMNQTCFEFCESQDMFFSYLDWTAGPKFRRCYCEKCDVFVSSTDQSTYKNCGGIEQFILKRD